MSKVKVRFFDDEVLEGEARDLDLDEPDFILEIQDASGLENSELAWIPLTAVKFVELPETEPESHTKKVAIRFLDGEVLRGWVGGEVVRHRYGVALHLHPEKPNGDGSGNGNGSAKGNGSSGSLRLAIPFSAIKALFYVREFDGRVEEDKGVPSEAYLARRTMAPLLDVLEEMDMLSRLHRGGLLTDAEYQSKRAQLLEVL
ncbi:MAG: hypothetical protein E6J02_11870 [Chloroflexi bacterium]|nr:MAG: hypothetical protein E6J02_11870 [Chloroflexota bacterium]TME17447.1 MAG: hypothetical protein E6I63_03040 [Chloroflexota bacterium]TME19621.1 MAG: hypothetical protein E6I70_03590 [Chloroflexota bacterium]